MKWDERDMSSLTFYKAVSRYPTYVCLGLSIFLSSTDSDHSLIENIVLYLVIFVLKKEIYEGMAPFSDLF